MANSENTVVSAAPEIQGATHDTLDWNTSTYSGAAAAEFNISFESPITLLQHPLVPDVTEISATQFAAAFELASAYVRGTGAPLRMRAELETPTTQAV